MPVPAFIGYGEGSLHTLSPQQLAHVREVGTALFEGRTLQAGHGGLIAVLNTPTEDVRGTNDGERQDVHRPEPRQGQGRQGPPRGPRQSRRGSSDPAGAVLRGELLTAPATGQLRTHYPGARVWREVGGNGTLLAVSIFPLGWEGPQADFAVAVPADPRHRVLAWGFWRVDGGAVWIGSKHTNYPDGSACAFPADSGVWTEADGITPYVDRLAEWSFRHIFLDAEGMWPGIQEGAHVYYRLRHTHPHECCTRCSTLQRYENCCRSIDQAEFANHHPAEFVAIYGCDVGEQRPHSRLAEWILQRHGQPPAMSRIHPSLRAAKGLTWAINT